MITNIKDKKLASMSFWSSVSSTITITATASNITLPSVTVSNIPSGSVISHAICILKIRSIKNTDTSNANYIDTDQYIQVKKSTGTFTNAIKLSNGEWNIDSDTKEFGDVLIGDIDVSSEVDGNGTYNFQLTNGKAVYNNLVLYDVLVGIKVYYK